MYRRILVGTDGSEHSRRALTRALELARISNAEITVITVLHLPASYLMALGSSIGMGSEPWSSLHQACEQVLAEAESMFIKSGIKPLTEIRMGSPAQELVQMVQEGDYDLIIVGSRGRGMTRAHLLGSVSDQISHTATCDLLIVH
jgi:nucleotide-binding universal stress UspA family protein